VVHFVVVVKPYVTTVAHVLGLQVSARRTLGAFGGK
jgi:hypothetical protein